jgi:transcriptional regulator with XRE-family HTH domain
MRQADLGGRIGVSRELISRLERGEVRGLTLGSVEKVAVFLGATVDLTLRWQGEQLDRIADAAHAAIQKAVAEELTSLGWLVKVEVSFNHYGDRGRVDVFAFHPSTRLVVAVEVKTALGDLQETLGRIDIKARLARTIAAEVGWSGVTGAVATLVIGDSRTARRLVAKHAALFARYSLRGRAAVAWLRQPRPPIPSGVLWFMNLPNSHHTTVTRGRRVRTDNSRP